jgi:hypothetical protein
LRSHPREVDSKPDIAQETFSCSGFCYSGIRHTNETGEGWYNDKNYQYFSAFWVCAVFQPAHYEGFVKNRSFSSYPP